MEPHVAVLVGFPILGLLGMAAYAYHDAPKYSMNPTKWAIVSFVIPFFGFFAYLFERDGRRPDTGRRDEMFADGPFEIHKSRAEDAPLTSAPDEEQHEETADEGDEWPGKP